MLDQKTVDNIKLNLPIVEKGGMSTIMFARAQWKTAMRILVDWCVKNELPLPSHILEYQTVKNYLQDIRYKKPEPKKKFEPIDRNAFIIYAHWHDQLVLLVQEDLPPQSHTKQMLLTLKMRRDAKMRRGTKDPKLAKAA